MTSCTSLARLPIWAIAVAGAIALAAPATVAIAQGGDGGKSAGRAAASTSGDVPGVVVQGRPKPNAISPNKRAVVDKEAAKRRTWQKYRATTAATPTRTIGVSAEARAGNYPGLHTLPH